MPSRRHAAPQILFGFDAQLRSFAAVLARGGRRAFVTPAPEMFSNFHSMRHLLQTVGARSSGKLVHIRFGPVRTARLLKNAVNVAVIAEDPVYVPANLGSHPFASSELLPSAVEHCLLYFAEQTVPRQIYGRLPRVEHLPPIYTVAELQDVPAGGSGCGDWERVQGVELRSIAEFDAAAWAQPPGGSAPSGPTRDLRRAMVKLRAAPGQPPPFIMLAWNVAHSGSIVPDIVGK